MNKQYESMDEYRRDQKKLYDNTKPLVLENGCIYRRWFDEGGAIIWEEIIDPVDGSHSVRSIGTMSRDCVWTNWETYSKDTYMYRYPYCIWYGYVKD